VLAYATRLSQVKRLQPVLAWTFWWTHIYRVN
jgi:hypothetical protein